MDILMTTQFLAYDHAPTRVFFFDRVSPAALLLAAEMRKQGTLVVFEPNAVTPTKLLAEALRQSDIVKYARDRLPKFEVDLVAARRECAHWLLEIETQGAEGLRFRMPQLGRSSWRHLQSVRPDRFVDGAGAGDWCSAVLIDDIGRGGRDTASRLTEDDVTVHLTRAQAFAAVACGFTGPRGLMSQRDLPFAERSARALLNPTRRRGAHQPLAKRTASRGPAWRLPCCGETSAPTE
ncbi:MAG: hypothetical protein V4813_13200 [Gemmatimonadota bacterium]